MPLAISSKQFIPSSDQAPAALLSRLLGLSPVLCAEGEITPVQAWNYIQQQPGFGGFELGRVRNLAEKLRTQVQCHGYVYILPGFDGSPSLGEWMLSF